MKSFYIPKPKFTLKILIKLTTTKIKTQTVIIHSVINCF